MQRQKCIQSWSIKTFRLENKVPLFPSWCQIKQENFCISHLASGRGANCRTTTADSRSKTHSGHGKEEMWGGGIKDWHWLAEEMAFSFRKKKDPPRCLEKVASVSIFHDSSRFVPHASMNEQLNRLRLLYFFHDCWTCFHLGFWNYPICAEGEKVKVRQFNFELTFNCLICKGSGLSQCSL